MQKLRSWYRQYERFFIPAALAFGFLSDLVMFRYVSLSFVFASLAAHLLLAGAAIVLLNVCEAQKLRGKFFSYAQIFAPLVLQYSFGSLFSAFALFYSASGSLGASWPFIAALAFLMAGNEIFKQQYARPFLQISAYFFSLFAFANWAVPYILRDLGPAIFLLSGLLSIAVIALFVYVLQRAASAVKEETPRIVAGVAAIFAAMNILYFSNIIPPIPLVLRAVGVYHNVGRTGDSYQVLAEGRSRGALFSLPQKFAVTPENKTAYVFSSVFSPSGLNIEVVHEWQKWDSYAGKWITTDSPSFSLAGGRNQGYRGYSWKTNIQQGLWRVNVKTAHGQLIGRTSFSVVESGELPALRLETK